MLNRQTVLEISEEAFKNNIKIIFYNTYFYIIRQIIWFIIILE